jgi:hypothetical protein
VVAKVRERLAVNKQRSHRVHVERFNLKKFNDVEGKEQFRVEVSNRFAALEDLDAEVEINNANESLGYFELKKREGHAARMGEKRDAYRLLVGMPEGERPLGRPRRRWADNIKMDLKGAGWG